MHLGKYSQAAIENASLALVSDTNMFGEPWVPAFEAAFSGYVGAKFAIAVNSATSGLHAALLAAGVGPSDEVISPGLTVIMDAYATIFCGATPIFADVDPSTWNITAATIEPLITDKTKVILTVSWFGHPVDHDSIHALTRKYGLVWIDDSAETIIPISRRDSGWGLPDMRVFSFESKKHFSTGGEGGMVTTDDPELATLVRKRAGIGYLHLGPDRGRTHLAARDFQNPEYRRFDTVGYNYRMTPVSAAIGAGQLQSIDEFLDTRREVANLFLDAIEGFDSMTPQNAHSSHSYYTFGVEYFPDRASGISWQSFYDKFTSSGGDGFYANCLNPYLEPSLKGRKISNQTLSSGLCPIAEGLQTRVMAFKTNYLDLEVAKKNANLLHAVLEEIEN
jgi:perosamine synthetase